MNKGNFWSKKRNVVWVAILYTFLWGSAFPLVKICLSSFSIANTDNASKCLVAGLRFFFSGILTLLLCAKEVKKTEILKRLNLKYIVLYGVLGTAFQYAFTYIGLSYIDASKGAIFDQLSVFLIVLFSGIFFKDDGLNANKILGCTAGVIGILSVNFSGLEFGFSLQGEGIMILAAICSAGAYFLAKKSSVSLCAPVLVGGGQILGGALLIVFSLLIGGKIESVNLTAVLTLLALTGISSVAYVLSLKPLKYHAASEISSFQLLITVFGAITSSLLLGESILKWNYLLSIVCICLGIYLVNKKVNNKAKK